MNANNGRPMQRITRHVLFGVASVILVIGFLRFLQPQQPIYQISMATAYGSLLFLALALMIGPWNVLRHRTNPLSSYLRRDFGIWAGILAVAHVIAGLQVHMVGKMWLYFLPPPEVHSIFPVRVDPFGLTNYAGLVAVVIFAMLLCLSNNASLRVLGGKRWKSLQRWNYAAAVLVLLHGWVYQILEKRDLAFVLVFAILVLVVLTFQLAGFRRVRGM
jgi:sulfoxide reductase heme-binding subunit YedZ